MPNPNPTGFPMLPLPLADFAKAPKPVAELAAVPNENSDFLDVPNLEPKGDSEPPTPPLLVPKTDEGTPNGDTWSFTWSEKAVEPKVGTELEADDVDVVVFVSEENVRVGLGAEVVVSSEKADVAGFANALEEPDPKVNGVAGTEGSFGASVEAVEVADVDAGGLPNANELEKVGFVDEDTSEVSGLGISPEGIVAKGAKLDGVGIVGVTGVVADGAPPNSGTVSGERVDLVESASNVFFMSLRDVL